MKGNVNLCRTLVKYKACLAAENHERVNIFNYQVILKKANNPYHKIPQTLLITL